MQLTGAIKVVFLYGTDLKPRQRGVRSYPEPSRVLSEKIASVIGLFLSKLSSAR